MCVLHFVTGETSLDTSRVAQGPAALAARGLLEFPNPRSAINKSPWGVRHTVTFEKLCSRKLKAVWGSDFPGEQVFSTVGPKFLQANAATSPRHTQAQSSDPNQTQAPPSCCLPSHMWLLLSHVPGYGHTFCVKAT